MKTAVILLAVVGALFGFIGAALAIGIGGLGSSFGIEGSSATKGGVVDIIASIVGLVGGVLVLSNPKIGGWLLIGSAIAGFVATFVAFLIAGVLFLIAGVLSIRLNSQI